MLRPVRSPDFRCFAIPLKVKKLNSNFRSHLGKFKFGLKTEKRPDRTTDKSVSVRVFVLFFHALLFIFV